jgi:hypothetical protein
MKKILITLALSSLSINAHAVELNLESLKDKPIETAVVHNECVPDVRVNDLNAVIDQIKAGTLDTNLQITPEDYIVLKPKVIDLLKDKYEVVKDDCTAVKVIGGELSEPIKISFATLWNEILKAATAKDNARVDYLISSFRAKPMTAKTAVFNLLIPADIPQDIQDGLANRLGVSLLNGRKQVIHHKLSELTERDTNHLEIQYTRKSYVQSLDIFRSLGGELTGELPRTITDGNDDEQRKLYKMIKDNNSEPQAIKTFALLGYDIVPMLKR